MQIGRYEIGAGGAVFSSREYVGYTFPVLPMAGLYVRRGGPYMTEFGWLWFYGNIWIEKVKEADV